jgi:type IV secretory pathway VirB2 component (pilin)
MYSDHLDDRKMQTFAEAGIPPQEIGHLLSCERCRYSYEQYLVLFALLSQREEKLMPGHAVERTREKLLTYARSRRRVLTLLLSLPLALSLVLAMGLYPEHPLFAWSEALRPGFSLIVDSLQGTFANAMESWQLIFTGMAAFTAMQSLDLYLQRQRAIKKPFQS